MLNISGTVGREAVNMLIASHLMYVAVELFELCYYYRSDSSLRWWSSDLSREV